MRTETGVYFWRGKSIPKDLTINIELGGAGGVDSWWPGRLDSARCAGQAGPGRLGWAGWTGHAVLGRLGWA